MDQVIHAGFQACLALVCLAMPLAGCHRLPQTSTETVRKFTETTVEMFMMYWEDSNLAVSWSPKGLRGKSNRDLQGIYGVDAITRATSLLGGYFCLPPEWGPRHPMCEVTWAQAVEFCRWLRKKTGRPYRLATEAEWEYACRAGSRHAYSFGDDPERLGDFAWYRDNSDEKPHPVAQKRPSRWGLYDMHGNVAEWCHDLYAARAYDADARKRLAVNPLGPEGPALPGWPEAWPGAPRIHVARGGSFDDDPDRLRSAAREREEDWWRFRDPRDPKSSYWLPGMARIGFRVACDVP
jgi:formylglycine-generating enzyme required for sulfatase activity